MTIARRILLFAGAAVFAVYALYWLMFSSYMIQALTMPGGWRLWFDTGSQEGVAGPLFLWFLTIFNPFTIAFIYAKWRKRRTDQNAGATLGPV